MVKTPAKLPRETQQPPAKTPQPSVNQEKALSLQRSKEGWVVVSYRIEGESVLERRVTQPNLWAIAVEEFKRLAGSHFSEGIL
jgi:hypothetical protein